MWQAIAALTSDFDKDPGIRVVVTRGTDGKAYVSGADISEFDDKFESLSIMQGSA